MRAHLLRKEAETHRFYLSVKRRSIIICPMSAGPRDKHAINFSWLIKLRWGAIAGQVGTILGVHHLLGISLPLGVLFAVVGMEAASNVACALLVRGRRPPSELWIVTVMSFDTLVLTALLYLSGGPFNPFSFLYLVQIALAAVVLRARFTWALVILSLACSALLFVSYRELPIDSHADHMDVHLRGMWVAFGVAAAFIVYFLMRVTRALSARDEDLARARAQAARQERLASLATLAAGAAHELSTPLSTIALAAKELQRQMSARSADAQSIADIELIREQVARCREILEQMAADAGESSGDGLIPLAVSELVDRARQGLSSMPAISVEIGAELASTTLVLPPRAVAQALRGILKNAQDASAAESTVQLNARAKDGWLNLEVQDRGSGMAADVLERAGEPFFTTKEPGRGMGLGLFLTRTVMERLGGRLRVESQTGRGTTATLLLPLDTNRRGAKILRMAE
jgi:two-component system, sensor histidine kinase RegB